jgi:hypothetical protein
MRTGLHRPLEIGRDLVRSTLYGRSFDSISNLKQLTLKFPTSYRTENAFKLSLNTFLTRQCPDQLESLCIQDAVVTVSLDDTQIHQHFKTLKVYGGHIDAAAFKFLSEKCPHLRRLVFSMTLFPSRSINLPSHNMDLLDICYPGGSQRPLKVEQETGAKFYGIDISERSTKQDDIRLYSTAKQIYPIDLRNIDVLDFVCRSIRIIILNGHVVAKKKKITLTKVSFESLFVMRIYELIFIYVYIGLSQEYFLQRTILGKGRIKKHIELPTSLNELKALQIIVRC